MRIGPRHWRIYRWRLFFYLTLLLTWQAPSNLAGVAQGHLILVAEFVGLGVLGINPMLFWHFSARLSEAARSPLNTSHLIGGSVLALCALASHDPRTRDLLCRGILLFVEYGLWTFEASSRQKMDPPPRAGRR